MPLIILLDGGPPKHLGAYMTGSVRVLRLGRPTLQHDASTGASVPTDIALLPHIAPYGRVGEASSFLVAVSGVAEPTKLRLEVRTPSGSISELYDAETKPETPLAISYQPEETGPHTLAASLLTEEPVRKTWRFDVSQALQIRTRVAKAEQGVAIEVQVENVSESAITIESVNLLGSSSWQATPATESILLKPRDIAQYLLLASGHGSILGKVFIRWRHEPLGGTGKSSTPELRL